MVWYGLTKHYQQLDRQ